LFVLRALAQARRYLGRGLIMRTLTLKRTVSRLAALAGGSGPCPACSGQKHIVLRGDQPVPTCPVCGRDLPAVRIVRDPNFYGNADRLRQIADSQGE
jgi:hypothetical protein